MALAQPVLMTCKSGQDVVAIVTLTTYMSIAAWTVSAKVRAYNGGPVLFSGVATPTDTGTVASWSIAFAAADTAQPPGSYIWEFDRTNAGFIFPICDPSAFRINAGADTASPTFTTLSEFWAHLKYVPSGVSAKDDPRYKQDLQILAGVEAAVHRYCGRRNFFYAQYTEYIDAPVVGTIRLKETPVWSPLVSIQFDAQGGFGQLPNSFDPVTSLLTTDSYFVRIDNPDGKSYGGEVYANRQGGWGWWGGSWAGGWGAEYPGQLSTRPQTIPGAFKIVYHAGYTLIPDDLRLCVWQLAANRRAAAALGQVMNSESMEGYSYSISPQELFNVVGGKAILDAYRDGRSYVA